MNEITLHATPKQFVIIFFDKTRKFISESEEAFLFSAESGERGMCKLIDGTTVNLKSIAKVITESQFSNEYPQKSSIDYANFSDNETKNELFPVLKDIVKDDDHAKKHMKVGINRYLNSTKSNPIIDSHGHKVWCSDRQKVLKSMEKYDL